MLNVYVIYLGKVDGDVVFLKVNKSYNNAISNIDSEIVKYAKSRFLEYKVVDKSTFSLEELRVNKKFSNGLYFKKKKSTVVVYEKKTVPGYVYNTVCVEKIGKIGVSELNIPYKEDVDDSEDEYDYSITDVTPVTYYEHGQHVTFVQELKNVLKSRKDKSIDMTIVKPEIENDEMKLFVDDLIRQKSTLRKITPPPPRKLLHELSYDSE